MINKRPKKPNQPTNQKKQTKQQEANEFGKRSRRKNIKQEHLLRRRIYSFNSFVKVFWLLNKKYLLIYFFSTGNHKHKTDKMHHNVQYPKYQLTQ